MNPLVSVIMPVFNGEKYLHDAIESILNQSFSDFEFIIINDGSTDSSFQIIKCFNDDRIKVIDQKNLGLIHSLNNGLNIAKGKWIARMDADDIAYPNRLEEQIKYIDEKIAVIGCQAIIINSNGQKIGETRFDQNSEIIYKKLLRLQSSIIHPGALINKEKLLIVGGYDQKMKFSEDFDLWIRLSRIGKLININKSLLSLRKHDSNISKINLHTALLNKFVSLTYHYKFKSYEKMSDDLYLKIKEKISFITNDYINKMVIFESAKSSLKSDSFVLKIRFTFSNPLVLFYFIQLQLEKFFLLRTLKKIEF